MTTVLKIIHTAASNYDRFSLKLYVDGKKTVQFWANTVDMNTVHIGDFIKVEACHNADEDTCKFRVDEVEIDETLEWVQDEFFPHVKNLIVKEVQ